ncbi:MAG: D-serine ammonia-lyase [Spirochaetaceae bacterium]|nr:MAG: D-serine ammonia-lyase [Spirochaetaceae bacterium]
MDWHAGQPDDELLHKIRAATPLMWYNTQLLPARSALKRLPLGRSEIDDAAARLARFAPLLSQLFPDTQPNDGIIESPLRPAPALARALELEFRLPFTPRIALKCDNELPVAGSIKARGGVYEVLCLAEQAAIDAAILPADLDSADYRILNRDRAHQLFSRHTITVASTGNLGLSVGITGRALGFKVEVHMSHDARAWKKRLLRERGAAVVEHRGDYSTAVAAARRASAACSGSHFVDDERSEQLFLGYSVAALRLNDQLAALDDAAQKPKCNAYLPCGVGGGPGGVAFGLKHVLGDRVRCYFAEPTHAPCFLLAMLSGTADLHVSDYGLDGLTAADGLAVGMPSPLVLPMMRHLLDGCYTCTDQQLMRLTYLLWETEGVRAEPSAAAALAGPLMPASRSQGAAPPSAAPQALHLCWLTGGAMLPEPDFYAILEKGQQVR